MEANIDRIGSFNTDPTSSVLPAIAVGAVTSKWSWASAHAKIPQVQNLQLSVASALSDAEITVTLRDSDVIFGRQIAYRGPVEPGTGIRVGQVHVPLSASLMARIVDQRDAIADITVVSDDRVIARDTRAVTIQPSNLWNWDGDPMPAREGAGTKLSRALLASFVRPNHTIVVKVAREAATKRGELFGDESFYSFQISDAREAAEDVERSVTAVYEAIRDRRIAYSEPPPNWDLQHTGQRVRDHGDVAEGGLGTCLDTTVLLAAVLEHIGLQPVMVLLTDHIFVGYWRADTEKEPSWYTGEAVSSDHQRISQLVTSGLLGVIETTALTSGVDRNAAAARTEARKVRLAWAVAEGRAHLIDIAAARRQGVSPLPSVHDREDGVTEVVEFRMTTASTGSAAIDSPHVTLPTVSQTAERVVDLHPARYRAWKASLFTLNATNALLNLPNNARTQPIVLAPQDLGRFEDLLNQDRTFTLRHASLIPELWRARGFQDAGELLSASESEDHDRVGNALRERTLYSLRIRTTRDGRYKVTAPVATRELRSIAHAAKTARDERGMNPLYVCFGFLRWSPSPGRFADAPLILVPVTMSSIRKSSDFALALDPTRQTTTNAALVEWLRREHNLNIPGLIEPTSDGAGIDINSVIDEVGAALLTHKGDLRAEVVAEARLATLDLSSFRMWQDLNLHADQFIRHPLIRHLIETPADEFIDGAIAASTEPTAEQIEDLETPVSADSTQKRAVLWAQQGRSFVLQGPLVPENRRPSPTWWRGAF
ncbi:DUF4011 domain-containing protein [Microbacterium sp. NC79]|uniref:DUF4011 domain-containing protein n=1 Tax=Microbacterium sp. NC79 TaxID=2851009 RepID=UPI001C2B9928|nr:DUF4011 domain-containing protein [Microbacterium sp. NC79]MBV0895965.1 DUF4011 domain-containing protein [Microbacterium sp. NC79]